MMTMSEDWANSTKERFSMNFGIETIETLLKEQKVEIQEGVFLCCDKQLIHLDILLRDGNIVVEFASPFTYLHVEKLGIKKLMNVIRPRVESVTITDKSYDVKLSSLGTWSFER